MTHEQAAAPVVTSVQALAFRLRRHRLIDKAPPEQLQQIIGNICGLQAQIPSAAEQAAAARVTGLQKGMLATILRSTRLLVRTWLMRGTVHIIPSAELSLYVAAVGPAGITELHRWLGTQGLTSTQINRANDAVCRALEEGPLTRQELADRVVTSLGASARHWIEHSWGGIVKNAALSGVVCFGENRGIETTFVLTDKWLNGITLPARPTGDEARCNLLDRYLRCYGPATIQGFARWAGIKPVEARRAVYDLSSELNEVMIKEQRMVLRKTDLDDLMSGKPVHNVTLLPAFDPYLFGCANKYDLVDERYYKLVYRKAGWISAAVLVNGKISGVWNTERKNDHLLMTVIPFTKSLVKNASKINIEASKMGRVLGLPVTVLFKANI